MVNEECIPKSHELRLIKFLIRRGEVLISREKSFLVLLEDDIFPDLDCIDTSYIRNGRNTIEIDVYSLLKVGFFYMNDDIYHVEKINMRESKLTLNVK